MQGRYFIYIVLGVWLLGTDTFAQEYRKIRVGAGAGYGTTFGENRKGGPLIFAEPAILITDKVLLGIRLEGVRMQRGLSSDIAVVNPTTSIASGTLFSQFYFGRKYVRTFFGIGVGYILKSDNELVVDFGGSVNTFKIGKNDIGYLLRAGLEWGHFTACVDVNFMEDEIVSPFLEIKNTYPAIRLGILLGGGIN